MTTVVRPAGRRGPVRDGATHRAWRPPSGVIEMALKIGRSPSDDQAGWPAPEKRISRRGQRRLTARGR